MIEAQQRPGAVFEVPGNARVVAKYLTCEKIPKLEYK